MKTLPKIEPVVKKRKNIHGEISDFKFFTDEQKQTIKKLVEENDSDKLEVLNHYGIQWTNYIGWWKEKKSTINLSDKIMKENNLSKQEFNLFIKRYETDIMKCISELIDKYQQKDIVFKLNQHINDGNINDVASAGGIRVDELKSFLQRRKAKMDYFVIENIKEYLKLD